MGTNKNKIITTNNSQQISLNSFHDVFSLIMVQARTNNKGI